MLEGKALVGETDMQQVMQEHAMRCAAQALDYYDVTDYTDIARSIKQEFDERYGYGWQCVVGTNFGSYVTHCCGRFIYFCVGSLAFMLFKGSGAESSPPAIPSVQALKEDTDHGIVL